MASSRAAKRPKVDPSSSSSAPPPPPPPPQRGDDDYVPGNIVEIELCNFMTYDHLTCRPGPRLNLVVGPNGSGKSSLVCAIALALAADPAILGRASSVAAFVKRGEDSGHVKISLRGNTPDHKLCITRKVDTNNKSEWQLDGTTVPKKEVIDLIKKFNIQVNNLTQFLPQDRVCEFAKLTPIQLLEETEKAVGDPNLPIQHRQLIDRSKELKILQVAVKQKEQTLNNLKALNAELEKDVERVRQRDRLLKKAELMKKKLPWLKYDMKKKEYKEAQEKEKTEKKKMEEVAKIWEDSKGPVEELKKKKMSHTSNTKRINSHMVENMKRRQDITHKELQLKGQLRATLEDIEDLKRQERSRQQRILKAKEALAAAERELDDLQPYEAPKAEMIQLTEEIARLTCDINELKRKKTDMESQLVRERENLRNCSDRLKQMENKNNKLLQALRYSGAEKINEAYNWVQDNRHMFRAEVYGPVLLEVNVQDKVHASYLEGHVASYIWKSFITQDASDRDLLVRQMKQYDIPVLNFMGDKGIRREPFNITLEMQQVGIYSRLDQVFEAPPAVKDVLISQANLDRSYIGTDETHNRADDVPKLGISDFWTPDNHYRWSRSRYGGHLSAFVDAVNPSRLFMCNLDVIDSERLRSQKDKHIKDIDGMDEDLKKLLKEQRQLEDEAAKIRRKKEEITDTMIRMLETIYKEEDMESSKRKFVDQAAKLNDQRYELVLKLKDLLIEAVALKWSCTQKNMASIELDTKIWEMEKDVKKLEKNAIEAAKEYENCKRKTQEHKQQLSNAKQHAESIAMISEDLAKKFLEMPTTIEELDCAIQDTESEANSMLFLNQNVLLEYQSRQREIESISGKLEDDKGECERCYSDIEATKGKWLPTLRTLVSKINSTFSRNFQEMAVAGEVSLDEHGLDFEQYGILIKVKFRSVAGVERSSPIWRGAISFNHPVPCITSRSYQLPLSGMDPINERKMFQQLVRAASQPNTPHESDVCPSRAEAKELGNPRVTGPHQWNWSKDGKK
uniref:Structural maintenance of chromosomes protein 5 n=1 Tax=Oryza rufipogon TaxID=4529 RepID=A0A0E0PS91_ORYRU